MLLKVLKKIPKNKYSVNYNKKIHWNSYDYSKFCLKSEYANFIVSTTNCILILSLLFGLEQYSQKNKIINTREYQINDVLIRCLKNCKTMQNTDFTNTKHSMQDKI